MNPDLQAGQQPAAPATEQPTPARTAAQQLAEDPQSYFATLHEGAMKMVHNLSATANNAMQSVLNHYIGHYIRVIEMQAKELVLFKEMEHYIRSQSLTPELLGNLMGRLDAFRAEMQAENAARTAAQTAK